MAITKTEIQALRREAVDACDVAQRIVCDMALMGHDASYDPDCLDADGLPDYSGSGYSREELAQIKMALRLSRKDAWAECERVIEEARA